jgi:ribosomal protein S18 acetylase RimI-like enzyme
VQYDWPTELSRDDMVEMLELMNAVAVRERTLGFFEPLDPEAGMALMQAVDADIRRGAVQVMAVRTDEGQIVGMVTMARAPLPARRHVVDMRRCVIAPEHRGQFLLEGWEHALRKAITMGCDLMTLEVRADGPVGLWRRLGFQEYGRLPDYARNNGDPVTGHFMYARCREVLEHRETTGSWLHHENKLAEPALA